MKKKILFSTSPPRSCFLKEKKMRYFINLLSVLSLCDLIRSQNLMCDYKPIEEGDFRVENDNRTALFQLAHVKEISGRLILRKNSDAFISAPLLEHIHGVIELHENMWLRDIIFPRLVRFDAKAICSINNPSFTPDSIFRQIVDNQERQTSHASDEF